MSATPGGRRPWPTNSYDWPRPSAYTTLGFVAARTSRLELLAMVTAPTYRSPGLLAKIVSTLDVLSGGTRLARHRRRLIRGGGPRPRSAHAPARRALRASRGGRADLPADVERRQRTLRQRLLQGPERPRRAGGPPARAGRTRRPDLPDL